jgi:calcineurin-like phosphoesterase family protein
MKIKDIQFDKNNLFFTADTHFYHSNIIKFCNRPYKDRYEMCNDMREKWNNKVPKDGVVFHLGDVALNSPQRALNEFLYSLNGKIHLVIGNHEKDALRKLYIRERWETIHDISEIFVADDEITYKEQHIVMCHYPISHWNASHRGSWHLFGHVHGGLSNKGQIKHHPASMDVGVDCHNFTPISYEEVKLQITQQLMKKQ